jgi:hypothetical protein
MNKTFREKENEWKTSKQFRKERGCPKLYRYAFPLKYLNCLMWLEAATRYTVSIRGNPPICHVSALQLLFFTSSLKMKKKSFMDAKEH